MAIGKNFPSVIPSPLSSNTAADQFDSGISSSNISEPIQSVQINKVKDSFHRTRLKNDSQESVIIHSVIIDEEKNTGNANNDNFTEICDIKSENEDILTLEDFKTPLEKPKKVRRATKRNYTTKSRKETLRSYDAEFSDDMDAM